jgi:hypothetical protein
MKRNMIFGFVLTGLVALANGCSSTPPSRDYSEYSGIRPGQTSSGDPLGQGLYARSNSNGEMNGDVPVSPDRTIRQKYPRYSAPTYTPPRPNVAGLPQD